MRLDIPEGADFEDMPILFGFGRIHGRSATPINERYLSIHLFGVAVFSCMEQIRDQQNAFPALAAKRSE